MCINVRKHFTVVLFQQYLQNPEVYMTSESYASWWTRFRFTRGRHTIPMRFSIQSLLTRILTCYQKQESCAIAKMTAQCAL